MWLSRRTPLSILFSGISGGMPALAGRVLGLGRIDAIGLLLAAGILERIARSPARVSLSSASP